MRTYLFSFLLLTTLTACSENQETDLINEGEERAFEAFVAEIPLLEQGMTLKSGEELPGVSIETEFIPEGASLIGKLKSIDENHFIVYSYPADIRLPILEIYNSTGEKLNEKVLFGYGDCPLTESGSSECTFAANHRVIVRTFCDTYFSKFDVDTIKVKELLKPIK